MPPSAAKLMSSKKMPYIVDAMGAPGRSTAIEIANRPSRLRTQSRERHRRHDARRNHDPQDPHSLASAASSYPSQT